MIYKWFGNPAGIEIDKSSLVGLMRFEQGQIETGETEELLSPIGTTYVRKKTKPGVFIEVKDALSSTVLSELDAALYPLQRDGATKRNLLQEIDDLKTQITTINTKLAIK